MGTGLLGIEGLDRSEIEAYLNRAKTFQSHGGSDFKKLDTLRGKMLVNLFFENSTRTRTSFEMISPPKRTRPTILNCWSRIRARHR